MTLAYYCAAAFWIPSHCAALSWFYTESAAGQRRHEKWLACQVRTGRIHIMGTGLVQAVVAGSIIGWRTPWERAVILSLLLFCNLSTDLALLMSYPSGESCVRPQVLIDGRPAKMSRQYIAYLKASFRRRVYFGGPEYTCTYCKAFFWFNERAVSLSSFHKREMFSNRCCKGRMVRLDRDRSWPDPLNRLIGFSGGAESSAFMQARLP